MTVHAPRSVLEDAKSPACAAAHPCLPPAAATHFGSHMTFLSYAQNFEDVMLWRALRQVQSGFYIDVGAQHPDTDSVTRAFYDHGWRGVNIEPVPEYIALLRAARPRDINIGVAVGQHAGEVTLHVIHGSGLSTTDAEMAARYAHEGQPVCPTVVPARTLAEICRDCAVPDIHFLKIDAEQSESDVLAGADFATYRPWILVIEATRPNSSEPSHAAWEGLVLEAGYRFVWFDGLNRFYIVAERHDALAGHFQVPPNVFDDFLQVTDWRLDKQIMAARRDVMEAAERATAAEAVVEQLEKRLLKVYTGCVRRPRCFARYRPACRSGRLIYCGSRPPL
jgi:FkbM family methyltransferase